MNSRFWLIIVNETSNTIVFDGGKRSDHIAELPENGSVFHNEDHGHTDDKISSAVTNTEKTIEREAVTKRAASGIYAYGFGIWGWCGWSDDRWTSDAICTKKPFWQLPKDSVSSRDNIDQILRDLPPAIKNALSITSFFLLFAPFLVLTYLVLLVVCINFKGPYPPWPVPRKRVWAEDEVRTKKNKIAWMLRNWRIQLDFFVLSIIFILPAIVTIGVGINNVKSEVGVGGGLKAEMGHGSLAIIAAWVLFMCAQLLSMSKYGLMAWRKDVKMRSTK
ncbi:uncharacterized protein I303_100347 [Kwoniella dejecticola CBS 10117]|uniref:Uncharacterized protein n=1 Tax=Kwoniella dejecticola CBS 10117 TaxID=1296121 RepID=A0A1A6AEN7_9TREE|nr:uncharacterized protein I303_00347 [Kwoniella dejecticola CBS 10117]OBR88530.1 hypothetical protein I303_00347 [Kwoniella dejecticola CBS 10117]